MARVRKFPPPGLGISGRGLAWTAATLGVTFGLIQLVPYRVDNPPVVQEPTWDHPRTRQLAQAACFDCHSNETDPYWFEEIAPISWLVANDVRAGRKELNLSECEEHESADGDDAAETVLQGEMPPGRYTFLWLHPDAELTDAGRRVLAEGLRVTLRGWRCDRGD